VLGSSQHGDGPSDWRRGCSTARRPHCRSRAALFAAPCCRSHSRDHGVSAPAAGVRSRPAAALTGSLTPWLPTVLVTVCESRSSGRKSAARRVWRARKSCGTVSGKSSSAAGRAQWSRVERSARPLAITHSMLALCSAACKALRFASTALPRGLWALTSPRSSSNGNYVMAIESCKDTRRCLQPVLALSDHPIDCVFPC
jgi:hypothetical protein